MFYLCYIAHLKLILDPSDIHSHTFLEHESLLLKLSVLLAEAWTYMMNLHYRKSASIRCPSQLELSVA